MRPAPVPQLGMVGVRTPLITATDDILDVLFGSLGHPMCGLEFEDGDVLVVAESPLATTEGRLVQLSDVKVSDRAQELSVEYSIDAAEMELILQECDEVLGGAYGAVLTITRGILSPNAGIDSSNAPAGFVTLLPKDPQASAKRLRDGIYERCKKDVAVIVGDSRTQPLRLGCVGVALGCAGMDGVEDARGQYDLYGQELHITRKATADNLVSASQLLMGEADESVPFVVVRGSVRNGGNADCGENYGVERIARDECMYFKVFH